ADVTPPGQRFELGRAVVLRDGRHLTLAATGGVVGHALAAAVELARTGIEAAVLNVHTLKPLDAATLEEFGARTGGILTVEDHGVAGGLGGAVCEAIAESGTPVRIHAVHGFGESGTGEALYAKHGLDAAGIATAARRFLDDRSRAGAARRAVGTGHTR